MVALCQPGDTIHIGKQPAVMLSGGGAVPPHVEGDALLLESGDYILLEDGGKLLLEVA